MGCYPLFACQDWSKLAEDLDQLGNAQLENAQLGSAQLGSELVSLSIVTDPFGEYDPAYLERCFPDLVVAFKEHFVTDLSRPRDSFVPVNHRRNTRRAQAEMEIEKCANPAEFLDDWTKLYATLVARHGITGILTFSRESFARQLQVPGIVAFRAVRDGETLGMLLWYEQGNRAYYHLGAYSSAGYDLRASFALFSYSMEYFAEHGIKWLSLGAGAGSDPEAKSGLTRFKEGWATETRKVYFCGRIFDPAKYQEIVSARHVAPTKYFPAYRAGEFA